MSVRRIVSLDDITHHSAKWHPSFGNGIRRRIRGHSNEIAKHLNIQVPPTEDSESQQETRAVVDALINAWPSLFYEEPELKGNQKTTSELRVVAGIPDAVPNIQIHKAMNYLTEWLEVEEEIAAAMLVAWTNVRDHDRVPNTAGVRKNLKEMLLLDDSELSLALDRIDGNTFAHIYSSFPEDHEIGDGDDDPDLIRTAIENALETLPESGRGRPRGSNRTATTRLGIDLGEIFLRRTGKHPRRSWDYLNGRDTGPFLQFVESVLEFVPENLLQSLHGRIVTRHGTIDAIARDGARYWKKRKLLDYGKLR